MKKIGLLFVVAILTGLVSGCVSKVPLSAENKAWEGKWVTKSGMYIEIFADGTCNLKMKSDKTKLEFSGAAIRINTNSINVSFLVDAININLKVNRAPKAGDDKLIIENVRFTRKK